MRDHPRLKESFLKIIQIQAPWGLNPADCNNYRPISLLQIGYKIYAQILLTRLQEAGAENRLWNTQFGFRKGRGTTDALFAARRAIESARATKEKVSACASEAKCDIVLKLCKIRECNFEQTPHTSVRRVNVQKKQPSANRRNAC